MRILIIADYVPYPLVGGDRIRIYNLLRRVASRHEVSLAAFLETPKDAEGVSHLRQFCARVETATLRRRSPLAHLPGLLRYALKGKPPELKFLHSEELAKKIGSLHPRWILTSCSLKMCAWGRIWKHFPEQALQKHSDVPKFQLSAI